MFALQTAQHITAQAIKSPLLGLRGAHIFPKRFCILYITMKAREKEGEGEEQRAGKKKERATVRGGNWAS